MGVDLPGEREGVPWEGRPLHQELRKLQTAIPSFSLFFFDRSSIDSTRIKVPVAFSETHLKKPVMWGYVHWLHRGDVLWLIESTHRGLTALLETSTLRGRGETPEMNLDTWTCFLEESP